MIDWIGMAPIDLEVGRIFCMGGNYKDHQKEMDAVQKTPSVFVKVPGSLINGNRIIEYPQDTENFHFEGELVLLLGPLATEGCPTFQDVVGITAGLDLTKRDVQQNAKKKGRPWEMSKSFPGSARLAPFVPTAGVGRWKDLNLVTKLDGEVRQTAYLADMIMGPDEILAYINEWMPLKAGDLIFTGTPKGVGPLKCGENICVELDGYTSRSWEVVQV